MLLTNQVSLSLINLIASGGDLGLSLTGLRMAPREAGAKVAKVGIKNEVVRPEHGMSTYQPLILKVRKKLSIIIIGKEWVLGRIQDPRGVQEEQEQEEGLAP